MIAEGREPPDQFYQQPKISDDLAHYWHAFVDLSSERQIGMGVGPIPRSALVRYAADEMGIEDEDRLDRFCAVIRRVDDDYIAMSNGVKDQKTTAAADINDAKNVMIVFGAIERRNKNRRAAENKQ